MKVEESIKSDSKAMKILKEHKDVILLFLASRLIFIPLIFLAGNTYAGLINCFDGELYATIARDGYGDDALKAFFPMIPLLIKFIGIYGTVVINNICFLLSLFILKALIGKSRNKLLILMLTVFSPISFFSMTIYTESIFFLLTIASYYLYTQKRYPILMGVLIGLSVFTRNTGSIVFFAIFIGMCVDWRKKLYKFTDILKAYIPATLISLIYPAFLQIRYGNWKYFMDVQGEHWSKVSSNFIKTLYIQFQVIFTDTYKYDGMDFTFLNKLNEIYTLAITAVFIYFIAWEVKKIISLRKDADIVSVAVLIMTLLIISTTIRDPEYNAPTVSFFRYYLVMFPAYTLLRDKNEKFVLGLMAAGTFMSIFASFLFAKGVYFF